MKARNISLLWTALALAVAVILGVGAAGAATGKEFVIGYVTPETGRGAKLGESHKRGAAMAVDEINAKGDVAGGKLKVIFADGKCTPVEAANAAERLIVRDKVDVLMGENCSSATLAMLKAVAEHKVPLVVPTSTAPAITACDAPTKGYVFRLVPTNDLLAAQLAKYILDERRFKQIAVITDVGNDWSVTLRDAFLREAKRRGIELTGNESVQGTEVDFYSLLQKVKAKQPEAVFMNVMINQGPPIVRQAHEIGLKAQLFSAQGLSTADMERTAGREAEGMVALAFYHPENPDPLSQEFTRNYAKRYPGMKPDHYDVQPYDAIHVIADALGRAGGDKAKFLPALASTKDRKGVLGTTTFDACGQSSAHLMMIQFQGGKMVPMR